jgi:hypothetical protein
LKLEDIKPGMKIRLVTQEVGGHKDYYNYDWKIGDIMQVLDIGLTLYNLRTKQKNYCIPEVRIPCMANEHYYSEFFEPLKKTLMDLKI